MFTHNLSDNNLLVSDLENSQSISMFYFSYWLKKSHQIITTRQRNYSG